MLNSYGIGSEQVRTCVARRECESPQGTALQQHDRVADRRDGPAEDGRRVPHARRRLQNGAACPARRHRERQDSVEDLRNAGLANGKPAVLVILFRQPAANIIDTVDRVRALLPALQASIPPAIKFNVVLDRTTTIRASIADVQFTLMLSIGLVIMVVFLFLRNATATLIPERGRALVAARNVRRDVPARVQPG